MRFARAFNTLGLRALKRCAIVRLLPLVVLREQWSFLLPIRSLDVVDALRDRTQLLVQLLLLFFELLDLQAHKVVRAQILHFLFNQGQLVGHEEYPQQKVHPRRS